MSGSAGSGFDKLALIYRWLEVLTFGPFLQRTRLHFLADAAHARHALVLGDGDGRFCVELLRRAPVLRVTAVDASAAMLRQTLQRAQRAGVADRLTLKHENASVLSATAESAAQGSQTASNVATLPKSQYDLVCTHFFLDCLSDEHVLALVRGLRQHSPQAAWLVSEFAVPRRGAARLPARLVVRGLYFAFGLLTGLPVRALPDYATSLRLCGWVLHASHTRCFGLLRSELWLPIHDGPQRPATGIE